jgi:hypothetical protein
MSRRSAAMGACVRAISPATTALSRPDGHIEEDPLQLGSPNWGTPCQVTVYGVGNPEEELLHGEWHHYCDVLAHGPANAGRAFHALLRGLIHENPVVRWRSVQLVDHGADVRAIKAPVPVLDDPVPRVRRNAVHALSSTVISRCFAAALTAAVGIDQRAVVDIPASIDWDASRVG